MINAMVGYGKIKIKKTLQQPFLIKLNALDVKIELAILNKLGAKNFHLINFLRLFLTNIKRVTIGFFIVEKSCVTCLKKF